MILPQQLLYLLGEQMGFFMNGFCSLVANVRLAANCSGPLTFGRILRICTIFTSVTFIYMNQPTCQQTRQRAAFPNREKSSLISSGRINV